MTERTLMSDALDNDTSFWENLKTRTDNVKRTASRQKPDETLRRFNQLVEDPTEFLDNLVSSDTSQQIIPVEPSFRSEAAGMLAELMGGDRQDYQRANKLLTIGDALPYAGNVLMADDIKTEATQGNYKTAAALSGLAVLPYGNKIADAGKVAVDSASNLINQTAANVPTLVDGFYSGKPWKFLTSAIEEIPEAITSRTEAASRAFQDLWGFSKVKQRDLMNQSKSADKLIEQGRSKEAAKSGQDSEKTAMAIEAQQSPVIIPVEERGALANSVYGLDFYARALGANDSALLAETIGNGKRLPDTGTIPDNVVSRFMNQLLKGPHVNNKSNQVVEFQVKTLDSSRGAGLFESAGTEGKGAPLLRAFNVGKREGKSISPFLAYAKAVDKNGNISPVDTVEFTQLAATLDSDATRVINSLLPKKRTIKTTKGKPDKEGMVTPEIDTAILLHRISRARVKRRAGKKLTPTQYEALTAFEEGISAGSIKLRAVKDETGKTVSNLDYSKIGVPEGAISAQQSTNSMQKELGGVNQMLVIDPYNRINYSMLSDGHDIYGYNPIGGHQLVTAQPIVMQPWSQRGYVRQHQSNATQEKISKAVQETERRIGKLAPKGVRKATNKNSLTGAKNWTKAMMNEPVVPSPENIRAANQSTSKLQVAKGVGTVAGAGGLGTGLMMVNSEE